MDAIINGEIIIEKKNRAEIASQLDEKGFDSNPMKMKNATVSNVVTIFEYVVQIDIH